MNRKQNEKAVSHLRMTYSPMLSPSEDLEKERPPGDEAKDHGEQ
jgi:hypothetical protein